MPFGLGQRNCIGRRFATIELKMALTQIVRHFEILPSPNEVSVLNPKMMDFGAKNSVTVILKRRGDMNDHQHHHLAAEDRHSVVNGLKQVEE